MEIEPKTEANLDGVWHKRARVDHNLTSIRKTITTTTTTSRRFGLSVGGKRLKEQKSRNGDKSKHSTRGEGGKGGGACWVLTNWVTTGQWGRQWQRLCPSCQLERAANTVWWNTSHTLAHTRTHTVIQRLRNEQVQRECGHWKMLPQLLIQLLTCHSVAASSSR